MLKFFRKYNKIILVFGASLLMVAFLLQPVIGMLMPDPKSRVIGHIGDEAITYGNRISYANELKILQMLRPLGQFVGDDPVRWMLITRDARQMGLGASQQEVSAVLSMIGVDQQTIGTIVRGRGVKEGFIRQAVAHWIMSEQYAQLMDGNAYDNTGNSFAAGQTLPMYSPALQRLGLLVQMMNLQQQAQQAKNPYQQYQMVQQFQAMGAMMQGRQRLSAPLIRHVVQDQQATISGQVLVIPAEVALDQAPEPSDSELAELFQQYRDTPAGEGQPWGLGYKIPDRVKLTWLTVPIDRVRQTVQVDEAEAVGYYDQHPEQFTQPATPGQGSDPAADQADKPQPYAAVRDRIIDQLREQHARDKARQVIRAALSEVTGTQRALPTTVLGYRKVPEDFQPMDFTQIAAKMEQRFGVRPEVHQRTSSWLAVDQASSLPGLGNSHLADREQITFPRYLASARGLDPAEDNPLVTLRLQDRIAAQPMTSADGSTHLFRLTAAQAAHAPASLDEIRDTVTRDARRISAYKQLVQNQGQWLSRAKSQGLEAVKADVPLGVLHDVSPTPRHIFGVQGQLNLPDVPGVGRSAKFINGAFELAQSLTRDHDPGDLTSMPQSQRTLALGIDSDLSLAIFRLDRYQPLTRSAYQQQANSRYTEQAVDATLHSPNEQNPLSLSALKKRMHYVDADEEETGQATPADTAPKSSDSGSTADADSSGA